MKNRDILVTTTSTLDGWRIEAYLDTVSSHIVAGTDIFTDFFASFSDIFGGRSKTYQKELTLINNEVIKQIKQKAFLIGANCILGLRIDHDEISGKGKQMFMVTALGTAVKAVPMRANQEDVSLAHNAISYEDLTTMLIRKRIVSSAAQGALSIDSKTWDFLIQNEVYEVAAHVLGAVEQCSGHLEEESQTHIRRSKEYFYKLPQDKTKKILYEALPNNKLALYAVDLLGELNLLDLNEVHNLLDSSDFELRKSALKLLSFHKSYYTADDIVAFEKLLPKVKEGFPPRGERISEKGRLTSKVKEYWKCECGEKMEMPTTHCYQCFRDIYGFKEHEVNSSKATAIIINRVSVLKEQFSL